MTLQTLSRSKTPACSLRQKKSSKIPETFERRWFDLLPDEISKLVVFDL